MRIICTASMRYIIVSVVVSAALFARPSIASAQGFGVGARMAWVKADSDVDVDSVRFTGGQVRLLSSRWGLEVSLDHHSETFELLNQKVTEWRRFRRRCSCGWAAARCRHSCWAARVGTDGRWSCSTHLTTRTWKPPSSAGTPASGSRSLPGVTSGSTATIATPSSTSARTTTRV